MGPGVAHLDANLVGHVDLGALRYGGRTKWILVVHTNSNKYLWMLATPLCAIAGILGGL